ncbi:MAG: GAF domain-containing protein [Candidatus Aminicenantes bacterium]|nr:GAF domain-containing protein [Candidatus Aminicenantes bacterium]
MTYEEQREKRYERIYFQLKDLLTKTNNRTARMSTIAALLHHKFSYYFWTGFYLLEKGELIVGPYQGSLACQVLEKNKGVCWAGIREKKSIVVPNVLEFPNHIACDSRSNSEIVIPLLDNMNNPLGVLDVDSQKLNAFSEIDNEWLEKIVLLI